MGIDQADGVALANEGHRGALDDGNAQLIGQQPHHGRVLHPGQLLQSRAALAQGDEEDVAAQVGSKNGEEFGPRHLAVAHDLDGGGGGDAEAGIVAEEVTYADGQQHQPSQGEDQQPAAAAMRPARLVGNETAANGDAAPGTQKPIFFRPVAARLLACRRLRSAPLRHFARAVDAAAGR